MSARLAPLRRFVPAGLLGLGVALSPLAGAESAPPWRLSSALDLPNWLEISGEQRSRYETLDGQFRAGFTGSDQAVALRTSLLTQFKAAPGRLVIEAMDSRHYLSDEGSPIDTTMVNAVDLLQAHARWDAGPLFLGGTNTVRLGRETVDLGMRRLVARNAFRNTINSFTGADWLWQPDRGGSVRAFYFLPVKRLPDDAASLLENEIAADTQSFDTQFWGLYSELPKLPGGVRAEAYYLRLQEEALTDTRRRHLHTPGLRVFLPAKPGHWDFEVEGTYQLGSSKARTGLAEPVLDHEAHHLHAGLGYTFAAAWQPRVGVRYDHASGDADPTDRENGRFDTLYGARRFDFGPTGLYGAAARANLESPEYSLTLRPTKPVEVSLSHRFLWLSSARDAWTSAGVRDASGRSGSEIGHQLELRLRWDLLPGNLRLDTGYTHLFAGRFLELAPNSTRQGDVNYAYFELTLMF